MKENIFGPKEWQDNSDKFIYQEGKLVKRGKQVNLEATKSEMKEYKEQITRANCVEDFLELGFHKYELSPKTEGWFLLKNKNGNKIVFNSSGKIENQNF